MASPSILRIERLNYGIGAVLAIASLFTQSRAIALGICVGVALTCVNFYVLACRVRAPLCPPPRRSNARDYP